ncbi:hypothetical protein PENARI_c012G11714 [Penicillium arizonense]|uniref:Mitochondrial thiamine pyrophosphate carrier 1 n=1 Tax=Penicillium arizonense TaxID=1835702 RepID=A0A1F5LF96_PENAI|nr:hypothetical protein PENARI_c012G11714 [Penicillium arizonense]OGE51893.1 hypothetical protein PENARI_c012G11714 [Penicillium arizonense]
MDKSSVMDRMIAGSIAGSSETIITYPAEFCKTTRQLQTPGKATSVSSLSILKSTYNSSGIQGIYRGCRALAISNAAKSGIRFLSFETSRDYLDRMFDTKPGRRSPWVNALSGLSAGVTESVLVVTPGEALKTKIIHDSTAGGRRFGNRGLLGTTSVVIREEGVRSLWSGLVPVLCKQGTNSAVRFTTFSMMQEKVINRWPQLEGNLGCTWLLGALSGAITVYASMPFDNAKTKLQSVGARYTGMMDYVAQTIQSRDIRGFWRGTSPRLVRLTLSSSITFTVYDQVVQAMKSV